MYEDQPNPGPIIATLRRRSPAVDADQMLQDGARYGERAASLGWSLPEAMDALLQACARARVRPTGDVLSGVARGYASQRAMTDDVSRPPLSGALGRLTALHRISRAATASLDLDGMLRTVVHVVREAMVSDSSSIFLYDAASNMLVLRASVGLNPDANGMVTLPLGGGITGTAAVKRELLAVPDAQGHPAYQSFLQAGDQGYTSQVSAPLALRSPNRLIGVLNIHTRQRRVFDRDELAFLQTAADEIAVAIENALLYSETDAELQLRVSQLTTLQRVTRLLASTLNLPDLVRLVGEEAIALTGASAIEIYRVSGDPGYRFELLARHAPQQPPMLELVNSEIRLAADDAVESGKIRERRLENAGDLTVQALPMLTARGPVGAICLFSEGVALSVPDSLLYAFSDVVAMALVNAELFERANRNYRRASAMLQEMHHRVRNNLQTVAALLSMQARHAANDVETLGLREAVNRIQSIAAVHDVLTGQNLREASLETIARHVVEQAAATLVPPSASIAFDVEPTTVRVSSRQATVLALLINEFLANAIIHGFSRRSSGRVTVTAFPDGESAVLEVADDGDGLPEGFTLERSGLGLQIARTLAESDLRGTVALIPGGTRGTTVRVRFTPEPAQ